MDALEFMADDTEEATGVRIDLPMKNKGAEILFVTPSGDFVADLISRGKLKLDPSRNDHLRVTYHDSLQPGPVHGDAGVAPPVAAGGGGLGTDENVEMRFRGGLPLR